MILYTIAVSHASQNAPLLYVGIVGGVGFFVPWVGVKALVKLQKRIPEWQQELGIGVITTFAGIIFSGLKAGGLL